jgi:uncharacterized iron-regulated protein
MDRSAVGERRAGTTLRARASRWWLGPLAAIVLIGASLPASACKRSQSPLEQQFADRGALIHVSLSVGTGVICPQPEDLILSALGRGGIVFLGEVHDNPLHHVRRAELLGLVQAKLPGMAAVGYVFEHIRADHLAALTPAPSTTDALFAALDWDKSGWPDKGIFAPLFQQVLGRPIYAGEPARGTVRDVARQGLKALSDADAARFKLDVPLPETQQDALLTELEASHCGLMPKTAFGTMAVAQRYRDAYLADAAMTAAGQHGSAVVLTGNGHARRDRGAPFALTQRGFDKPVLVILFTESVPDKLDPAVADVVISTTPATRKDPCEEMRARFGKKG